MSKDELIFIRFLEAHTEWSKGAVQEMVYDMGMNLILDGFAEQITKEEYNQITFNQSMNKANKKQKTKQEIIREQDDEKEQEQQKEFEFMYVKTSKEILESDIPPTKYLIQNLLVEKSITIIGGDSGVGKSWFAIYSALKVSNGYKMFQSFETIKSNVLYIDEENNDRTIKDRLKLLEKCFENKEEKLNHDNITWAIGNDIKLDKGQFDKEPAGYLKFRYLIEKYKPQICIIDSLVRFFQGDENSSNDIKKIYDTLKWAMKEHDTSFMILHHTSKGNNGSYVKHSLRGSGDISAQSNIVLMMNKIGNSGYIKIDQVKNRHDTEIQPFNMLMKEIDGQFTISYGGAVEVEKETIVDNGIKKICEIIFQSDWLEFETKIMKPQFISKGETDTNYYRVLKQMEAHNLIKKLSKGKYKIKDTLRDFYDETFKEEII